MAEELLERYCDELINEQPKIDLGIKNFISLLIANNQINEKNEGNQEIENITYIQFIMSTMR